MGDLFDRNVHPLYAVMAFVCATIVLILLLNHLGNNRKERKNELLSFLDSLSFIAFRTASGDCLLPELSTVIPG